MEKWITAQSYALSPHKYSIMRRLIADDVEYHGVFFRIKCQAAFEFFYMPYQVPEERE